ncbi:MAG: GDSL family lipase [Alistipes sp.]|nr:GDSL family lipase [Alistipes sp.]
MKRLMLILLALCTSPLSAHEPASFPAASPEIRYIGRTAVSDEGVSFDWSGCTMVCRFTGRTLALRVSDTRKNYYNLTVDGRDAGVVVVTGRDTLITLAANLPRGEHLLRMQKRTEAEQGCTTIHAVLLDKDGRLLPAPAAPQRHIEFIGNSLTCGYGTEGLTPDEPFKAETENCDKSFSCIIARYFGADYTLISHSGQGAARNYGDKNTASTLTMVQRIGRTFDLREAPAWDFAKAPFRPDLVVINLGTNDFSTLPHPSREEFRTAYLQILATLREAYGDRTPILCVAPRVEEPAFTYIREICLEAPYPNLGFAAVLPGYCNDSSDLGSSAHPNYAGQRKMAMLLIPYISTLTGWEAPMQAIK